MGFPPKCALALDPVVVGDLLELAVLAVDDHTPLLLELVLQNRLYVLDHGVGFLRVGKKVAHRVVPGTRTDLAVHLFGCTILYRIKPFQFFKLKPFISRSHRKGCSFFQQFWKRMRIGFLYLSSRSSFAPRTPTCTLTSKSSARIGSNSS